MTLIAQFEASADRWPDRTAVVDPSGEAISYRELHTHVCRLAGFLTANGVSRGDRVVWRWRGSNPHNVRFRKVPRRASKRGSDTQSSGRFARTFDRRGTYRYVCTIHEDIGMRGSVNVD